MTFARRQACAALLAAALPLRAQRLREVHGAHDAWAEPGLALAWGVQRGRDEASTRVVIRIELDPQRHARVTALGRDPFGDGTVEIAVAPEPDGAVRIELPRSHFADHPRTELRFFAPGQAAPDLLVYYQGLPDTTPEFNVEATLQQDLRRRIARARDGAR